MSAQRALSSSALNLMVFQQKARCDSRFTDFTGLLVTEVSLSCSYTYMTAPGVSTTVHLLCLGVALVNSSGDIKVAASQWVASQ